MKLSRITSYDEFISIMDQLEHQGFYFDQRDTVHRKKVEAIFKSANTMDINFPPSMPFDLFQTVSGKPGDYLLFHELSIQYFSKFDESHKITQLIRENYLKKELEIHCFQSDPAKKKAENKKFLSLYIISEKDHGGSYYRLYNLNTKTLKIYYTSSFEELIQRTIAQKFKITENLVGKWHCSDQVEYKLFLSGQIEIKHPRLDVLKSLYKKDILSRPGFGVKKES